MRLLYASQSSFGSIKINLSSVVNTFENIMENGAFAPKEQMIHFPKYFQVHDIPKALKGIVIE